MMKIPEKRQPELLTRSEVLRMMEALGLRVREARRLLPEVPDFPHTLHSRRLYRPSDVTCFVKGFLHPEPEGKGEG